MTPRAVPIPLLPALLAILLAAAPLRAQVTYPPRPADREIIADAASLITPDDAAKIRAAGTALLDTRGISLVVATISSMADFGAANWQIERYAHNLFDEWGISSRARNYGILLLVSKGDRKVRIELGAAWNHDRDTVAANIINSTIVPRFKAGQYSTGIREGADAIAARIGGLPRGAPSSPPAAAPSTATPTPAGTAQVPVAPSPMRQPPSSSFVPSASPGAIPGAAKLIGPVACIIFAVILIVGLIILGSVGRAARRDVTSADGTPGAGLGMTPRPGAGYGPYGWGGGGGGGWGGFWPGLFLGQWLGGRSSSHQHDQGSSTSSSSGWFGSGSSGGSSWGGGGGGGFSGGGGGSFGGGFSGGGGATGSW